MDLTRLKELIELMNRHQLEELEIEEEGKKVRLRKRADRGAEAGAPVGVAPVGSPMTSSPGSDAPGDSDDFIRSPMVGTFYRAPNTDADPFVEVGDRVEEGKVLCIVEAMKVMNEIKIDRSATIEEILVGNGESVEYGQSLFRIGS